MLLNDLDDDSMLIILDRVPLLYLFPLNRVCHRWKSLLEVVCKHRRSLTLVLKDSKRMSANLKQQIQNDIRNTTAFWNNHDNVRESPTSQWVLTPKWSKLEYEGDFPIEVSFGLVSRLPNIQRLKIAHFGSNMQLFVEQLLFLLTTWSNGLVQLNLWRYFEKEENCLFYRLIRCINSMPSLRKLSIHTQDKIFSVDHPQVDLSILSQLEHFYICSSDTASRILESLQKFALFNRKLMSIRMINSVDNQITLENCLNLSLDFHRKFTHLTVVKILTRGLLAQLVPRFISLTSLSIDLHTPVRIFARHLRELVNLVQLELLIFFDPDDEVDAEWHHENEQDSDLNNLQHPTLRGLRLFMQIDSHEYEQISQLAALFPHVRAMEVFNCSARCLACQYSSEKEVPNDSLLATCITKLLKPWKQCQHLQSILCIYKFNIGDRETRFVVNLDHEPIDYTLKID